MCLVPASVVEEPQMSTSRHSQQVRLIQTAAWHILRNYLALKACEVQI